MEQSRRGLLKNAAKAAAVATGGTMIARNASAQGTGSTEKKGYPPRKATPAGGKAPLFTPAVSYGNMLFLSGVGAHFQGTIEQHTQHVLEELEKTLISAGSSMQKVLKVNVYLNDLKDYDSMNKVYATAKWGEIPPVRTTVSPAAGIPGNSLVEIDLIAYI